MTEQFHSERYYLSAGECGPERQMPVPLIASRMIEVATHHANLIGVGYDDLIANGQAWVLSRLTIEMKRYPEINETYSVATWVEGVNRHFSERNFEISDHTGATIGYGRSVWVAIDIERRTVADISRFTVLGDMICERPCPIDRQGRHRPVTSPPDRTASYIFRYSDLDFNRHVNSSRYIELLLNQWPLEFHDRHSISRIEISYLHEAHFGDEARIAIADDSSTGESLCDIEVGGKLS
ncbi:MAG: acyl-[acyl-carrier-protein] thioesterase, partial [Muribaculaceae bacterium]|nr:acyl-[acyl-carrier-protein] thioesterase [Muribaculaceae bacterium]